MGCEGGMGVDALGIYDLTGFRLHSVIIQFGAI